MRKFLVAALLALPAVALGRGTVRASFGTGGARGGKGLHFGRSGLSIHYGRTTAHSRLAIGFHGGLRGFSSRGGPHSGLRFGGHGGCGAYPGGVYLYQGGYLLSPYVYRPGYAAGAYYGGAPFGPGEAVVFSGLAGVPGFGYRDWTQPSAGAASVWKPPADHAELSAERLVDIGDGLFGRGQFARAVEAYRAAAQKKVDDPMPAFALGHGLFATGAYAEAAVELRRGLRLFPDMVRVRMNRRDFYGDPEAFAAQMAELARHVQTSPDDQAARFLLGYNYFFTQQYGAAKEQFALLGAQDREAQWFLREIERLE